ncbi:hypothetical protein F2P56_025030 [Juglans regia]|uniref:Protein NUCLEAR FUSION DEFECTIVE 4-like n=2 Tax=Juglans regia TaxID=51240 RepID=A0A833UDU3_JUGRE|nr:protein NUCLEAR FUSION DEFECTIVE 4-like [Juglans regia]KAF5455457.1 hypothetical protein F2P56_025030 [Juglans regia]
MSSRSVLQWLSLVAIVWLQVVNGTNFNFPAYSIQLKKQLSISQMQLILLAFAFDAGKIFGFLPGLLADRLPLWLMLLIGSILGFVGYGLSFLLLKLHIYMYWVFFLSILFASLGISWINTVCNVVIIRNFPFHHQQVVAGIAISYQGLSAKIYTDFVHAIFSPAPDKIAEAFLFLNSISAIIFGVIVAPILIPKIEFGRPRSIMRIGFAVLFFIAIGTGIYSLISSLVQISPLGKIVGMGVFLLLPLVVPILELSGNHVDRNDTDTRLHCFASEENGGVNRILEEAVKEGEQTTSKSEEMGVKKMVQRCDFYLYFFMYLCGPTLGLVFFNNLAQIAESRGHSASALVSLSSSFGFFGRLIPSFMDYCFSRTKYEMISRPTSLAAASMALMALAFFLLIVPSNITILLYISTAIIGVCAGAISSVGVCITADLFGREQFSRNHNVVIANIPVGSLTFGCMAAFLYRREGNGDVICMGMKCYRTTFVIWGSLCAFGTLLACGLYARTRELYTQKLQNMSTS